MVPITIVNGVYKPSYNWGAPHCSCFSLAKTPFLTPTPSMDFPAAAHGAIPVTAVPPCPIRRKCRPSLVADRRLRRCRVLKAAMDSFHDILCIFANYPLVNKHSY